MSEEQKYETIVSTVKVDTIMQEWMKGYTFKEGATPVSSKWYYDQAKGEVVFVFVTLEK
jgi:hypothetical protein